MEPEPTRVIEEGKVNPAFEEEPQTRNEVTRIEIKSSNQKFKENITMNEPYSGSSKIQLVINNPGDGSKFTLDTDVETLSSSSSPSESSGHFSISWQNLDYVVESKWYKMSSQRKPILNSLSGTIKSGEMSAILGPSGAGKSTLIDCLLGKPNKGLSGKTQVTFDDPIYEKERRQKRPLRIALIPQEDNLLDTLTVTETFMFASKIKNAHLTYEDDMDSSTQPSDRNKSNLRRRPFNHFANVQRVIQQLNLSSCASLKCGKLSGGQYKRVSIGQELLSRPDLMILDEPTSGLDSVTCFQTIKALRELIDNSLYPMAIVATIHQPDNEVFSLFHKAYVIASGGRAIYEGPTSKIVETVQYGAELAESRCKHSVWSNSESKDNIMNLKRNCDIKGFNPARLIVEVAANEYGYEITNALNDIQRRGLETFKSESPSQSTIAISSPSPSASSNSTRMSVQSLVQSEIDTTTTNLTNISPPQFDYWANDPSQRRADLDKLLLLTSSNLDQSRGVRVYLRHIVLHTKRSWLTILRDPMLFSVQIFLHIFVPLLISYAFQRRPAEACPIIGQFDIIEESYSSGNIIDDLNKELRIVFENIGYMFFQIYVIIFAAVCMTSLTYPLAMHVLLKEYRNGWYSLSSYFLGRTLADLPVPTFNVVLAMAISYHLTGQPLSPYAWRFLSVAMLTVLATLTAQTQGLMFGAMLMNAPQSAVFVAPASTAPLVVVSGFLLRIKSLPVPLQFLSQFSFFTHLLNGFIISRYGFNRCPCNETDFSVDSSREIPSQARNLIGFWVETYAQDYPQVNGTEVDPVGKIIDTINRAKTFGHNITECSQVKPFPMIDYDLNDDSLEFCFIALIAMLVVVRIATYATLSWKINSSI